MVHGRKPDGPEIGAEVGTRDGGSKGFRDGVRVSDEGMAD